MNTLNWPCKIGHAIFPTWYILKSKLVQGMSLTVIARFLSPPPWLWYSQDNSRHDDVIKSKHLPRYWPFARGIHRSPRSFNMFFDLCPNKRLSKQSWGWWFETPSRPLWHHCNGGSEDDIPWLIYVSYYIQCLSLILGNWLPVAVLFYTQLIYSHAWVHSAIRYTSDIYSKHINWLVSSSKSVNCGENSSLRFTRPQ